MLIEKDQLLDYLNIRLREEENRNDFGYNEQYELDKAEQDGAISVLEDVIAYIKTL